jgi:hypothetical protein
MSKNKRGITRCKFLTDVGMSAAATDSVTLRGAGLGISVGPAAHVVNRSQDRVTFPAHKVAYVVANPKSEFETKFMVRLKTYLKATLAREPRVVSAVH